MACPWLFLLALCIVSHFAVVFSFNVDVREPFIYSGTSGDNFGYSVTLHQQFSGKKWVVVGAPLGNKTSPSREHNRYGSVYKCNSDSSACEVLTIDSADPITEYWRGQHVPKEKKTGQQLGATVISMPPKSIGQLIVCAPRYTFMGRVKRKPEDRADLYLGKCFALSNDLYTVEKEAIHPCYSTKANDDGNAEVYKDGQNRWCEAGFSAASSSQHLLLGMPGRFRLEGSMAVYYSDLLTSKPEPGRTYLKTVSENYIVEPDDYPEITMGYAVAIGRFSDPNREEFALSSMRARQFKGKVMAFRILSDSAGDRLDATFTLSSPKNLEIASNFGQTLCAVDLNNDRYSDLLVAAPYYSQEKFANTGRVYVYMNNGKTPGTLDLQPSFTLDGPKSKFALFGLAMAAAGDLNRDGFQDVAISAPYGGSDQGGAVFIYFGKADGIDTSPRQIIEASDISPGVKAFGFSLASNVDVDNNGYPDLAVGAYASDKAFLLRSRPIVDMEGKITLNGIGDTIEISLEDNNTMQLASDGVLRQSINITVCLKFEDKVDDPSFEWTNATYTIELDKDRTEDLLRRVFFLEGNTKSFNVTRQIFLGSEKKWYCDSKHAVYLREKEKILSFDPLKIDLSYDLSLSPSCKLCPIVNDDSDNSIRAKVNFVKKCGADRICEPDLFVRGEVKFDDGHTELNVGDDKVMIVGVVLENKAQDSAYPGEVIVTYPSIIDYEGSSQDIYCPQLKETRLRSKAGERKVQCVVGNPFGKFAKKQFDIRFNTQRVTGNISELVIYLQARSSSKDANPSDNNATLKVGVKFETDLSINGVSRPDHVVYNDKASKVNYTTEIGPSVKNIITVKNNGPSPVEYAKVTILVPFKNKTIKEKSNYLLYLTDLQVLGNAGSCNIKTNPLNLKFGNNSKPAVVDKVGKTKRSEVDPTNEELPCEFDNDLTCLKVPCNLGAMKRGVQAQIQITSRLWQNTLIKGKAGSVSLYTTAKVTPSSSVPESNKDNNVVKILLIANPKTTPTSKQGTPVWVYVVCVLGGLALLALAGLALYKFGFFKRKRPKPEHTEEELTPMRTLEPGAADA